MINWYIVVAILFVLYILISVAYLSSRTEWYKCDDTFKLRAGHREATPKDAWLSLFWPVMLLIFIIKMIIWIINEFLILPCLLVGFRYNKTEIYQKLEKLY